MTKDKKLDPELAEALWKLINTEEAPQHKPKAYKAGWSHTRAEAARQRIANSKPYLFSAGAIRNLGKKIVPRNLLNYGLYSSVLDTSTLESVDLSVAPVDLQLNTESNYTSKQENEDTTKS